MKQKKKNGKATRKCIERMDILLYLKSERLKETSA